MTVHHAAAPGRSSWPNVSVAQMREVDRIMVEDIGISLLQMMENAGRATATLAREMLGSGMTGQPITVLAGRGGNGGGGMATARRLALWGAEVTVVLSHPPSDLTAAAYHQWAILDKIGVPTTTELIPLTDSALILDTLIGYSLNGPPRGNAAALIQAANNAPAQILSLDVPSGMHSDTGERYDPCITATATLTLALPKSGLLAQTAAATVGKLFVADISVPDSVYARLGLTVDGLFAAADIVRLNVGPG